MHRGRKPAGIDRIGPTRTVGPRPARWAMTIVASCAWASGAAEKGRPPEDTALADGPELRLTVTMDKVVHVDVPFTIKVGLSNPRAEPVEVLIVHHRTRQLPFLAVFNNVSGPYYSTALVLGEDKAWAIRSWDDRCGTEVPRSGRTGLFCPPTRNVYEIDGGGHLEFEETVRFRDYEGVLRESNSGSSGFVSGPHRMVVWVYFIENPAPYLLDVGKRIDRPFVELETVVRFDLETFAR